MQTQSWLCIAHGQPTQTHPCLSAPTISLHQALQATYDQRTENNFGVLLEIIAEEYHINIWCDRRIPKDTLVVIDRKKQTLEEFLRQALSNVDAGMILLDGVLMVVPRTEQDAIAAAYWKFVRSKAGQQLNRSTVASFGWPKESMPAVIFQEYSKRFAIDVTNAPEIEHDIWKSFEFRKATGAAIGTCILAGFDLSLQGGGDRPSVGPLDSSRSNDKVAWTYSLETLKNEIKENRWKEWRGKWPDAEINKDGSRNTTVITTVDGHRELVRSLIPQPKKEFQPKGISQFSGTLQGTLEDMLLGFGDKANLDFSPWPLPPNYIGKTIHVELNKASIDQALQQIGQQAGLTFERNGKDVKIILPN